MQENDSILTTITTATEDTTAVNPAKPQTPYEVLRLLPKSASPIQQDSAIQAFYQSKLDTNHIGVSGDPIPYTFQNDSFVTSILILCFLLIAFAISRISNFLLKQTKHFFTPQKAEQTLNETGSEIKFQFLFLFITCLQYALLYFLYTNHFISNTFITSSEYILLLFFLLTILCYMVIRILLYTLVNNVFFSNKKNLQFLASLLLITSFEGGALFPLVLLLAYFQFSLQNAIIYTATIVILTKILTFYKSYAIFFKQKGGFLQNILYFCALEMIPLIMLWSGLLVITEKLKINF